MSSVDIGVRFRLFENLLISFQALLLHLAAWLYLFEMLRKEQAFGLYVLPLSTPLPRWQYFLGRFFGVAWLIASLTLLFLALDTVLLAWISQSVKPALLWQVAMLGCSALLGMALMQFLAVLTNPITAVVYSIMLWLIGNGLDELVIFAGQKLNVASQSICWTLYYLWPNFSFFDFTDRVANGYAVTATQTSFTLCYCLGYCALLLGAACFLYQKQALQPMAE